MGGLARRATLIDQTRAVEPNVLLLDGGDTLTGPGNWVRSGADEFLIDVMNRMDYDAMVLGEIELTLGEATLRERIAQAQFPILSANVKVKASGELLCQPYAVLELGGRQVGVLGLTMPGSAGTAAQGETAGVRDDGLLTIGDPQAALTTYMEELRSQAGVIVVLGNVEWAKAQSWAESVPGIDLIVSNGPSELLTERWQSPNTGTVICALGVYHREYPTLTVNAITLDVDGRGRVTDYRGTFFRLGTSMLEDPEIVGLVDKFLAQ